MLPSRSSGWGVGVPRLPGALGTGFVAPVANPPLTGTSLVFNIFANDLENNEVVKIFR